MTHLNLNLSQNTFSSFSLQHLLPHLVSPTLSSQSTMSSGDSAKMHTTFKEVKIHTAKCDECDKHNSSTIYRCMTCSQQCCTPCWNKKGGDGTHLINTGMITAQPLTFLQADSYTRNKTGRKKKTAKGNSKPKQTVHLSTNDSAVPKQEIDHDGDSSINQSTSNGRDSVDTSTDQLKPTKLVEQLANSARSSAGPSSNTLSNTEQTNKRKHTATLDNELSNEGVRQYKWAFKPPQGRKKIRAPTGTIKQPASSVQTVDENEEVLPVLPPPCKLQV